MRLACILAGLLASYLLAVHVVVVLLVAIELIGVLEGMLRLVHVDEGRVARILERIAAREIARPDPLVEVFVVRHATILELRGYLCFGSIEDPQELIAATLGEPDLHKAWRRNKPVQRHDCHL